MLGYTVLLTLTATALVMVLFAALPGSELMVVGRNADAAARTAARAGLGLDQSLWARWWTWVVHALQADLGRSWMNGEQVTRLLAERLPVSLCLVVPGYVLGVGLAWWWVSIAAVRKWRWPQALALIGLVLGSTVLALLAHLLVRAWPVWPLGGLPLHPWEQTLRHLVWPTLVVGWSSYAFSFWHFRALLGSADPTWRTAGLARNEPGGGAAALRRVLAAAALTRLLYGFPVALIGAVVVETAFAVPGVASRLVQAMMTGDQPVILGVTVVLTLSYGLLRLLMLGLLLHLDRRGMHG